MHITVGLSITWQVVDIASIQQKMAIHWVTHRWHITRERHGTATVAPKGACTYLKSENPRLSSFVKHGILKRNNNKKNKARTQITINRDVVVFQAMWLRHLIYCLIHYHFQFSNK